MTREPVRTVKLSGKCVHDLDLVACDECRETELRAIRRKAGAKSFAELAAASQHDLDALVREAIPYTAAMAVLAERDRAFWLTDVAEHVFTVRNLAEFTRMMYGRNTPQFRELAQKYLLDRVRAHIRVRDAQTGVRIYVCWRLPRIQPRRWGALHHLGVEQLELVARDYGILGEGVQYSKDATVFLMDLLKNRGPRSIVNDVWDDAVPMLVEWKQAR